MILSSADILNILGKNEVIRLIAKLAIVDGRPALSGREGVYIYIDRFPVAEEFEATWSIYIEADEEIDLLLAEIKRILPKVDVQQGLLTVVRTTDFRSESTQTAPQAPKVEKAQVDLTQYEERFQSLVEDVQDQMLLVTSGRAGKDGRDGRDGVDGRDGRDLSATETELFDLKDADQSVLPMQRGQVLTWDGSKWTNLYIPQVTKIFGGGGGGDGSGDGENVIVAVDPPTTREDGSPLQEGDQWWDNSTGVMHVWYVDDDSSQWVQSAGSGGSGASELNELTDVTIDPALLKRDFGLVYDGAQWVVDSPPVLIEGHNQTGSTILKGTPVYVAGTHASGKPLLAPADANGSGNAPAIGLLDEDLLDGEDGVVMLSGVMHNLDTSSYAAGDALYLSGTPGVLTNVRPTAVQYKVQKVGLVTRSHPSAGDVLIIGAGRLNDITNELVALLGTSDRNDVDLGTFTGTTISDNVSVKVALQELETSIESGGANGIGEAPTDGQAYVRQNSSWQPTTTASISYNLSQNQVSDLGDTSISSAAAGEALIWNGSAWANGGDFSGGSF